MRIMDEIQNCRYITPIVFYQISLAKKGSEEVTLVLAVVRQTRTSVTRQSTYIC